MLVSIYLFSFSASCWRGARGARGALQAGLAPANCEVGQPAEPPRVAGRPSRDFAGALTPAVGRRHGGVHRLEHWRTCVPASAALTPRLKCPGRERRVRAVEINAIIGRSSSAGPPLIFLTHSARAARCAVCPPHHRPRTPAVDRKGEGRPEKPSAGWARGKDAPTHAHAHFTRTCVCELAMRHPSWVRLCPVHELCTALPLGVPPRPG